MPAPVAGLGNPTGENNSPTSSRVPAGRQDREMGMTEGGMADGMAWVRRGEEMTGGEKKRDEEEGGR